MTEIEIPVPAEATSAGWDSVVEACCAAEGLTATLRGTLGKYPGSRHWHWKQGRERGTLEITLWRGRLWISIQDGRRAAWIEETVPRLFAALQVTLAGEP